MVMSENLHDALLRTMFDRTKVMKANEYLIVDEETYAEIKTKRTFVPAFMQTDVTLGDTYLGLKISVRYGVDFGWRIA